MTPAAEILEALRTARALRRNGAGAFRPVPRVRQNRDRLFRRADVARLVDAGALSWVNRSHSAVCLSGGVDG